MTTPQLRLLAALEAQELLAGLFAAIDAQRYDQVGAFFAPDGRWFRQGIWQEGRDAILAAVARRPADQATRHILANLRVADCAAESARFHVVLAVYQAPRPKRGGPAVLEAPAAMAACHGGIAVSEGAWRLRELVVEAPEFVRPGGR